VVCGLFFGGQEHSGSSRHSSRSASEFAVAVDVARSTISRSGDAAGDRLQALGLLEESDETAMKDSTRCSQYYKQKTEFLFCID